MMSFDGSASRETRDIGVMYHSVVLHFAKRCMKIDQQLHVTCQKDFIGREDNDVECS